MSDPSTDSKVIREQQNKDTPERLEADETQAHGPRRTDTDARSGADRRAAKKGEATFANEQMDAIFNENAEGERIDEGESRFEEDMATDGNASLARKTRSILGD